MVKLGYLIDFLMQFLKVEIGGFHASCKDFGVDEICFLYVPNGYCKKAISDSDFFDKQQ